MNTKAYKKIRRTERRELKISELCRQVSAIAIECSDLLDRASAAVDAAIVPRVNRDEEIRLQTMKELTSRYHGWGQTFH